MAIMQLVVGRRLNYTGNKCQNYNKKRLKNLQIIIKIIAKIRKKY